MSFTQNDVNKLAHLARIALDTNSERKESEPKESDHSIAEDLNRILRLIGEINKINTDNIQPMAHSQSYAQPMRADVVTEPDVSAAMRKLVPEDAIAAGLYLVPQVVE